MILLAFVIWIAAEVAAAIAVAHLLGVLVCILLLIAGWPVGTLLVRAEGRATLRRLHEAYASGRPPAGGTGASALALLAGPLLIIPGFVTDALAATLLVPAVRRRLWSLLAARARGRFGGFGGGGFGRRGGARRAYDVDGTAHEAARHDGLFDRSQLHG